MRVVDYSINVYFDEDRAIYGGAKYTAVVVPSQAHLADATKWQRVYVEDGWLRPQSGPDLPPQKTDKPLRGEDRNSLLVLIEPVPLFEYVLGLIGTEQRSLIGLRARNDSLMRVYAHSFKLDDTDNKTLSACIDGIMERVAKLQARLKRDAKK